LETAQKNSDNEQSCGSYSAYSSSNESKYLKRQKQDSLDFGTGAAPQREGRQAATEATEDHQQEEELKAAAANNNNGGLLDDGCCEEAAYCELLPPKPAAAGSNSQESDFGSLLGKRNQCKLEGKLVPRDKQILFLKKTTEVSTKEREQKAERIN
jgi:hypothetical protein